MEQFSVCMLKKARPGGRDRLALVLQHDVLSDLRTRLIAPLYLPGESDRVERLMPQIMFDGRTYLVGMDQMITADVRSLSPPLGKVDARDVIMRAVDLIFAGF